MGLDDEKQQQIKCSLPTSLLLPRLNFAPLFPSCLLYPLSSPGQCGKVGVSPQQFLTLSPAPVGVPPTGCSPLAHGHHVLCEVFPCGQTACSTMVFCMGCRGTSAPAPGAPPALLHWPCCPWGCFLHYFPHSFLCLAVYPFLNTFPRCSATWPTGPSCALWWGCWSCVLNSTCTPEHAVTS